ncbi:hypothetical protein ABPG72_018557 [Tetrahymena utriculariae]
MISSFLKSIFKSNDNSSDQLQHLTEEKIKFLFWFQRDNQNEISNKMLQVSKNMNLKSIVLDFKGRSDLAQNIEKYLNYLQSCQNLVDLNISLRNCQLDDILLQNICLAIEKLQKIKVLKLEIGDNQILQGDSEENLISKMIQNMPEIEFLSINFMFVINSGNKVTQIVSKISDIQKIVLLDVVFWAVVLTNSQATSIGESLKKMINLKYLNLDFKATRIQNDIISNYLQQVFPVLQNLISLRVDLRTQGFNARKDSLFKIKRLSNIQILC